MVEATHRPLLRNSPRAAGEGMRLQALTSFDGIRVWQVERPPQSEALLLHGKLGGPELCQADPRELLLLRTQQGHTHKATGTRVGPLRKQDWATLGTEGRSTVLAQETPPALCWLQPCDWARLGTAGWSAVLAQEIQHLQRSAGSSPETGQDWAQQDGACLWLYEHSAL